MKKGFFTFDNLGGEYPQLKTELRRGTPTAVFGVSDSLKYLLAGLCETPVLYITSDSVSAQKAVRNIRALSGKDAEYLSAKDEVLLYRKALSKDSLFKRLKGVYALQNGCPVVVAEIDALLQLFPKRLPVITLTEGEEYDFLSLPNQLVEMGYTRSFEVESKGVFAVRGDILDIYPINAENPVRIDFFGDTVEKIKPYDFVTGDRLPALKQMGILSATDVFLENGEKERIADILDGETKKCKTSEAYARSREIADEIISVECNSSFVLPLLENSTDIFSVLPENVTLVFDEGKALWDKFNALYKEHDERFTRLQSGGEAFTFSLSQYIGRQSFLDGVQRVRRIALQTFTGNPFFFEPLKIFNFTVTPTPRYLNGFPALLTDIKNWIRGGYRVLLFCGEENRAVKMSENLAEEYISTSALTDDLTALKGVTVLSDKLEKGLVLHESKIALIGENDLYTKAPDNRRIRRKRGDMFSAPEVGDFVVHETHGIGKVVGTKKIETTDGTKE
ncbi:MAG: hypothetical protein E7381_02685, partial [Clostridiales bacterium]|nr:hypothetical protein [Clostridiales bacterium]